MDNTYEIVIGDWSNDGHNQSEEYRFQTNKTASEIRKAYLASCKLTGVSMHRDHKAEYELFTDYEDREINDEAMDILVDHGLDAPGDGYEGDGGVFESLRDDDGSQWVSPHDMLGFFMWFAGLSLPGLEWKSAKGVECINGYWDKEVSGIGYGLFS